MRDQQIESQVDKIAVPLWVIAVLLAFLVMSFVCDNIANAESAIVSFRDAEHLVALTDSVVGVCDRVEEIHCWYLDSDSTVTHYWDVPICRELVCVTVVPEPYGLIHQTTGAVVDTRQWAIIFYREVKQ